MTPLSPIGTLVLLSGTMAVLSTPPANAAPYDPDSATDYVQPASVTTTISGLFSEAMVAGIVVEHDALLLTTLVAPPAGFRPEVSRCLVNGVDYLVMTAQERWYLGVRDGYTMHLKL